MSTFIIKKKISENNWITIPYGNDETGVNMLLMKMFHGMVLDIIPAGLYTLPNSGFLLSVNDYVDFGITFATNEFIPEKTRICIGFLVFDQDDKFYTDAEYQIFSSITNGDKNIAAFNFGFSIQDNIVTNYTWQNAGVPSFPFVVRTIHNEGYSKCVPVIFAADDSIEFSKSYMVDATKEFLLNSNGIPASWMVPINNTSNNAILKVRYVVDQEVFAEFNMPRGSIMKVGENVNLPTYETVFNNSLQPFGWRIENVVYPLGSTYTIPDHNVTAELLYINNKTSGMVIL